MTADVQETHLVTEKIAIVRGHIVTEAPKDLYIPPDALEVILETFEGPLDLLLYLIRQQNLDILDIPIAEVTRQYIQYIELMNFLRLELAAEYLVMAAVLAEIKSRMLLPKPASSEDAEVEDPRAELIRRLQEYERFKKAAESLDELPRIERDTHIVHIEWEETAVNKPQPQVDLKELLLVLSSVLERAKLFAHHEVKKEGLSIRERMVDILDRLHDSQFVLFHELFTVEEGRLGVVVSFIAILELLKQSSIEIVQANPYAPIHVKSIS
jgi:segregation and condensation protein A